MSVTLIKKPIAFSVDQDELGWLELQASRIGNKRSQVFQDMVRKEAERIDGENWRNVVRDFVSTADAEKASVA